MRSLFLSLLFLGCGGSGSGPPSLKLTDGTTFAVDGCPFSITTPGSTTAPVKDDGSLGATPAPRNVHWSFVGDPTTSVSVTWNTDLDTRGTTIEWGADTHYGHRTPGFWFAFADGLGGVGSLVGVHQAHVCGLQPGTTYHYHVGTGTSFSPDATFTTAPADGRTVRILVAGDSRLHPEIWQQIMTSAAADAPDLLLYTGDAVLLGSDQTQWEPWFAAGKDVLPHLPIMTVNGNHEGNAQNYFAQFPLPGNQQWYSFDYGPAHFTVLNDTPTDYSTIAGAQAQFLDADLGKTAQKWKLVSHHRPEYTASTGHPPAKELQTAWEGALDNHHVDLVLNGHAHAYERSKPLVAGQPVADGQGPVYIVEGGGGADPYGLSPQPFTAFSKQTYGYVILDVSAAMVNLTAKAADGTMVDSYSLAK